MADQAPIKIKRQVSPGISGAISDAVKAVQSYMGAGRRNLTGNVSEDDQLATEDSGTTSQSTTPSNPGKQAQSTDAQNGYN